MGVAQTITQTLGTNLGKALSPLRAGESKLASRKLGVAGLRSLEVKSSAFPEGGALPHA